MMGVDFDFVRTSEGKIVQLDHKLVLNQLLTQPRIDSKVVIQKFLREYYDTYYGLVNHSVTSPILMPMIAYSPAENFFETSRHRQLMTRYRKSGVWDVFHLNFDQFINHSREEIEAFIEEAEFVMNEKAVEKAEMERKFNLTNGNK